MTEKMRSRVERVQEILESAQIPYERIMRSACAPILEWWKTMRKT